MKFSPFFFIATKRMDGYIAGIASGVAQTLVGHPLDTPTIRHSIVYSSCIDHGWLMAWNQRMSRAHIHHP